MKSVTFPSAKKISSCSYISKVLLAISKNLSPYPEAAAKIWGLVERAAILKRN